MARSSEKIEALEKRVSELERISKALVEAIANLEDEFEVEVMPEGEYHGQKFES